MVKIDRETIEQISKLVRISFSDEECEQYSKQLASIVSYVDQLESVAAKDVEPLSQLCGLKNVMREDEVTNTEMTDELLANAPMRQDGYLKVKVVK